MSRSALKGIQAAAGGASGPVYVDDVFSTFLYEGTGSTQTINNGIDLNGEGGLVWIKNRNSGSQNYALFDTARGPRYHLASNSNIASTDYGAYGVNSFNSNGFSLIGNGGGTNGSDDYVSWTFRKQPGFFDVVTYTGDDTSFRQIAHNLGSTPGMIIVKRTTNSSTWYVYHRSLPEDTATTPAKSKNLKLNESSSVSANRVFGQHSAQTSSVFTLGDLNLAQVNGAGESYVAYLFAHDAQDFGEDSDEAIIKCGTYTGNGSTTGPVIDLGFEPQWLMVKRTNDVGGWFCMDTMRGMVVDGPGQNTATASIQWQESNAEGTATNCDVDINGSGFQCTNDANGGNANGSTYIYVAIRRPHKPASEFAATDLFKVISAVSTNPSWVSGFPVDMNIQKNVIDTAGPYLWARLIQGSRLQTSSTGYKSSEGSAVFDYQNGVSEGQGYQLSSQYAWMWRRAPGFFDVVTYNGNSTAGRTVTHNLGAVPEIMMIKTITVRAADWQVYVGTVGPTKFLELNGEAAPKSTDAVERFNNTAPTASVFTLGNKDTVNYTGTQYIALLFATVAGLSKIGSYTGTGSDLNVDCGFSSGARFILIKRTDASGPWYVYDSARGIVAGDDPYLLLNSTAVDVTNTDYVDPLSSGFTVTSSAPVGLNNSGGTYIFYAIA